MNKRYLYIFSVIITSGIFACSTSVIEPDISLLGYEYYPLDTGQIRTYEIEEINYDPFGNHDTLNYELQETISSQYSDLSGELKFVLSRKTRIKDSIEWELDSIWSTYRNVHQAVLTKNGNPVISLVFPVEKGIEWDANSLFSRTEDIYVIKDSGIHYDLDGIDYPETLVVVQEDKPDSLIEFIYKIEVFTKGIGLIEKIDSHLQFCPPEDNCFGQKIVTEGRQYRQKLILYEE